MSLTPDPASASMTVCCIRCPCCVPLSAGASLTVCCVRAVSVLCPSFRRCVTDRRAFAKNVSKPWDGRANRTRFAEALQKLGSKYVASYGTHCCRYLSLFCCCCWGFLFPLIIPVHECLLLLLLSSLCYACCGSGGLRGAGRCANNKQWPAGHSKDKGHAM